MKLALEPTQEFAVFSNSVPARIWEGTTDTGVAVRVFVVGVEPQTLDPEALATFSAALLEVPHPRPIAIDGTTAALRA